MIDPKQRPAVSVIIPSYNTAHLIGEALDSVFAQTFTDFEVVVVNDGSPDTPELERVLEPYRDRIVYVVQENRGLAGARNTAIRHARADLLALLDSDDAFEPDYLAVQLQILRENPGIDVVCPSTRIIGDVAEAGRFSYELSPSEGEVTFEGLVTQRYSVSGMALVRREVVERAGMYDESLRSSEDFDMWLRILRRGGRILSHHRVVGRYRRRAGSLSSDPIWMCHHILKVLDKLLDAKDLSPRERGLVETAVERVNATLQLERGKVELAKRNFAAARRDFEGAYQFFRTRKLRLVLWAVRVAPGLLLRLQHRRTTVSG
jgi:glycosyltransferase involved in cell wall biosynthesis